MDQDKRYVFSPPPVVSVPIAGQAQAESEKRQFAVRRIYCVGRNYAAHAREMGHDPQRAPPFFFCKPADAVLYAAPGQLAEFPYPTHSHDVHYEVELVVAVGECSKAGSKARGKAIPVDQALDYVYGYAVGLDMTRRDLQAQLKKIGHPWEVAKGFDYSAPLGTIYPASSTGHFAQGTIWLNVNGVERQRADLSQMTWSVAETVSYLSMLFELFPGDLIYTGTPAGVGPVVPGDRIAGGIDRLGEIAVKVI